MKITSEKNQKPSPIIVNNEEKYIVEQILTKTLWKNTILHQLEMKFGFIVMMYYHQTIVTILLTLVIWGVTKYLVFPIKYLY